MREVKLRYGVSSFGCMVAISIGCQGFNRSEYCDVCSSPQPVRLPDSSSNSASQDYPYTDIGLPDRHRGQPVVIEPLPRSQSGNALLDKDETEEEAVPPAPPVIE